MLTLEAALLAVFVAMILFGPAVENARDWHGITAGLFAAMAMGAQSVLVRLLMKGIPQTNVMTGNMTQLGIATTELILAWRRLRHSRHSRADLREFAEVRRQLLTVLFIALGFLIGAAAGATAFAFTGLRGALLAVAIVGALALWALVRELIVKMDEMLEHLHEGMPLAGFQRREDRPLRRQHRGLDVADQPAAERRNGKRFGAPVDRTVETPDQFLFLEPPHHVADG